MSELSGHAYYENVGINHLTQMAIGLTLDDQPVPDTNQGLFVAWALKQEAHKYDLKPSDFEVEGVDIMAVSPDGYYFSVEFFWWVSCEMCEVTALAITKDSTHLCSFHWHEGLKQEQADLDNDDRAIGMQP